MKTEANFYTIWNCPLCNANSYALKTRTLDYNCGIGGMFTYVKCRECGLVRINPRPTDSIIPLLYKPPCFKSNIDTAFDSISRINSMANCCRSQKIEQYVKQGRILDIGCGKGFFLKFMEQRGWKVSGIEFSQEHIDYAKNTFNLSDINSETWPDAALKIDKADVVTMFHVIEHMPYPRESISAVSDTLLSDGILVIETPNINSVPSKIFGSHWVTLDAPRHLALYSLRTLSEVVEKAGFRIMDIHTYSPSTMEYSESLRYLLKDTGLRKYEKEYYAGNRINRDSDTCRPAEESKKILHNIERNIYKKVNSISDYFGKGCNLFLIAKKTKG